MGLGSWLERLFGANIEPEKPAANPALQKQRHTAGKKPRRFVEIVGESHYQDALSAIAGGKTHDGHQLPVHARLIPEDGNPFDPNAVRIEIQGKKVA